MCVLKIGELVTINPVCEPLESVARIESIEGGMVYTDDDGVFHACDVAPLAQTPDEWMDQDVEAWMERVGLCS